jgi:lysyl-tRNA synthetase class 1
MSEERELALHSNAWPFVEARSLVDRLGGTLPDKGYVLFETGYGPSGLPHIGTFGEVARTTMVRRAFELISDLPTRLFAFSDDMDGLRKVPDNIPNREMVTEHLGSATETYRAGEFDDTLKKVLVHYDAIMNVILPTLGAERQATYSPFLPVCPDTGQVLQVPVVARDVDAGTITYENEAGATVETPVTGGHCKLQW